MTEVPGFGWVTCNDWAETTLPDGRQVSARPNDESPAMAERLGYGADVAAMTRHHDPLHARLCEWMGLPTSYSLSAALGDDVGDLAWLEEAAVLALQAFALRAAPAWLEPGVRQ